MSGRRAAGGALVRLLLLVAALSAGGWKILALRAANLDLDRRSRSCEAAVAEVRAAIREARASRPRTGDAAPGFTLPALRGGTVRLAPPEDVEPVHLLFVDPWGLEPEAAPGAAAVASLLESYGRLPSAAAGEVRPRIVVLTPAGPEAAPGRIAAAVGRAAGLTARFAAEPAVAVHAWAVYRAYGILDGPAAVLVEGGRVAGRWSLPAHGDELPLE